MFGIDNGVEVPVLQGLRRMEYTMTTLGLIRDEGTVLSSSLSLSLSLSLVVWQQIINLSRAGERARGPIPRAGSQRPQGAPLLNSE